MEKHIKKECFQLIDFSFSYPKGETWILKDIHLTIPQGSFVVLCGKSGCGKTTLLRQLKSTLAAHGEKSGRILFEGIPLEEVGQREQASRIGFVLQSPDNQIVTDKVWHELAFGLESLGYDQETIRRRVGEMASFFGIQNWFHLDVTMLSGGQKQLLNLAAIMAMQPSVLILDEPTSQLDPIAAQNFLATIGRIHRELGTTIIMTEHRLEEVLPLADRAIVLDQGKVLLDGTPRAVGEQLKELAHPMFLAMPTCMQIYATTKSTLPCPLTVGEGRRWLAAYKEEYALKEVPKKADTLPSTTPVITLEDVWFRYEKEGVDTVKGVYLQMPQGSFYALVGGNGTGKSTTLSLVAGVRSAYRGKVKTTGRVSMLPQNPQALFVKKTVYLDLLEAIADKKYSKQEKEERVGAVVRKCQLTTLLDQHPYDLSGGEQQRVALAKVLLVEPDILLLDEPTKGLDSHFKEAFAKMLKTLQSEGVTILMVSHDLSFCAQYADRCGLFFDGQLMGIAPPQAFFAGNRFYTTATNRMCQELLPQAITISDAVVACGGENSYHEAQVLDTRTRTACPKEGKPSTGDGVLKKEKRQGKRTWAALALVLVFLPLTLFWGTAYLGSRKYYFISLLILLEVLVPFLFLFEKRKPMARELVVLATLSSMTVAARAAFFFLPQFKPVAALVIITAVSFGGEAGLVVGAVSMFVSNMFFGQGPWTPFQMFAMGVIGLLAGLFFYKGKLGRNRVALCTYGGISVLVLYGFLMNTYTVLQYQDYVTWEMILSACFIGLPMDLVHGVATVVFLAIAAPPMLEKLDRIKIKYGLM